MDKYQKLLVQKARIKEWLYFENNGVSDEESSKYWKRVVFDENNDMVTIIQDENPNIVDYILIVFGESFINAIEVYKKSKWEKVEKSTFKTRWVAFRLNINFDDRIEKVKVSFRDNLADDYIIDIKYQEADKEQYYAKKEQEYKDNLLKAADIKVSTGADLVNIYFQPCCDKYEYTEIQLYIPKEFVTVRGPYGRVQKPSTWSMIKKCKVDPDDFFKSINGLANGKYSFILRQYDKNSNILLETEHIEFSIRPTSTQGISHSGGMNIKRI